jgi:hypothetical protein
VEVKSFYLMVESWKSITKSNIKEIVKSWREKNWMVQKEKLLELIAWALAHCFYEFRIFYYFYKKNQIKLTLCWFFWRKRNFLDITGLLLETLKMSTSTRIRHSGPFFFLSAVNFCILKLFFKKIIFFILN